MGGWAVGTLILVSLSAYPPIRLSAQVSLHAAVGARYTTSLVHDSIVVPFDVRPAIGPALAIGISERSQGSWTPNATLDVSWSALQRHESGATAKITALTTVAFTVGLRHDVGQGLAGRVGLGVLKYLPSEKTGLFRSGSGLSALGTASLDWMPAATAQRGIGLSLQYDVHRFTTAALHAEGFTSPQLVHRVSLAVRARIAGGKGS
jgi:hypothetical protein